MDAAAFEAAVFAALGRRFSEAKAGIVTRFAEAGMPNPALRIREYQASRQLLRRALERVN